MREELVLRVAILGERFSPNLHWYVDTILKLMSLAGEHVSDQIWMRVVQIVTNKEELQVYAAETCLRSLRNETVPESMVKCGGSIIGEFGHLMVHKHESSPSAQWQLLKDKFYTCNEWGDEAGTPVGFRQTPQRPPAARAADNRADTEADHHHGC